MGDELRWVFKALADGTRRQILDLLSERPMTTGALCAAFPVSRFAVMKHLAVLERAGLVLVRRRGRERFNHLNAVPLQRLYERWMRPCEARWARSLLSLKRHIEKKGEKIMPLTSGNIEFGSMRIELEVPIAAPPENVFEALTGDVSDWWGRPYVHSDGAKAIRVEPWVGGRCWEDQGNNEGALYATIVSVARPKELKMAGPFGMGGFCHSVVTYTLEPKGKGTLLKVSHVAAGEIDDEARGQYSAGWEDLIKGRLVALLQRGEVLGLGHEPPPFGQK